MSSNGVTEMPDTINLSISTSANEEAEASLIRDAESENINDKMKKADSLISQNSGEKIHRKKLNVKDAILVKRKSETSLLDEVKSDHDADTELKNRMARVDNILNNPANSSLMPASLKPARSAIIAHIIGDGEKTIQDNKSNPELDSKLLRADRIVQSSSTMPSRNQSSSYHNIKSILSGEKKDATLTSSSDTNFDQNMNDKMKRVDYALALSHSKNLKERDNSSNIKATLLGISDTSHSRKEELDPKMMDRLDRANQIMKEESSQLPSKPIKTSLGIKASIIGSEDNKIAKEENIEMQSKLERVDHSMKEKSAATTTPISSKPVNPRTIKSSLLGNSFEAKSSSKSSNEPETKANRVEKTLAKSNVVTPKSAKIGTKGAVFTDLKGSFSSLIGDKQSK